MANQITLKNGVWYNNGKPANGEFVTDGNRKIVYKDGEIYSIDGNVSPFYSNKPNVNKTLTSKVGKSSTQTPSQQAAAATGSSALPTNTSTNSKTVGEVSAEAKAAADKLRQGQSTTVKGLQPGSVAILTDESGLPVYSSAYSSDYFSTRAQKGDKASIQQIQDMQRRLYSLNAYKTGYKPTLGVYTAEDINALNQVAALADQMKEPDIFKAMDRISKDSALSNIITSANQPTSQRTLTSTSEASAYLTSQFLDVFNTKPSSQEIKAYQSALNAKEKASKTGLSAAERDSVLMSVLGQKSAALAKSALAGDKTAQSAIEEGAFGQTVRSLAGEYYDNGVKTTQANLYKQAALAQRSQQAYNNIVSDIQINAKGMFPALAQYIDQGKKVRSILNSHINAYADIYGINPDQVDLKDVAFVANDQNKLMSTTDMTRYLWQNDPKIKETKYYQDVRANDAKALLSWIGA